MITIRALRAWAATPLNTGDVPNTYEAGAIYTFPAFLARYLSAVKPPYGVIVGEAEVPAVASESVQERLF